MILQHKKAATLGLHLEALAQIHDIASLVAVTVKIADQITADDPVKERDLRNQAKGDLFEVWGEYLCKRLGGDNLIPVDPQSYDPNNPVDGGVDAFGNYNGKPVTIQYKFRNPFAEPKLSYEDMSKFIRQSIFKFKVQPEDIHGGMVVITTAYDYNEHEYELGEDHPLLVNFDTLKLKVGDTNPSFWADFVASVKETYEAAVKPAVQRPLWQHQTDAVDALLSNFRRR